MDPEVLGGGVANRGAVVRVGDTVTRPAPPNHPSIHALFEHLADQGFEAPRPVGPVEAGRERLRFIPGEVPIPPYPSWALTDTALASVGRLLRRYHEAVSSFHEEHEWSTELDDPLGDEVVCHNDVCLENVVFRAGEAVALLDFDYAAPGRALWDLAMAAGMCVPIRPPDQPLPGQAAFDPSLRLGTFARAYGLSSDRAEELVDTIIEAKRVGDAFVARHVESGHEGFVEMVAGNTEGARERRLEWLLESRDRMIGALERAVR